jgi:hypothetical protein
MSDRRHSLWSVVPGFKQWWCNWPALKAPFFPPLIQLNDYENTRKVSITSSTIKNTIMSTWPFQPAFFTTVASFFCTQSQFIKFTMCAELHAQTMNTCLVFHNLLSWQKFCNRSWKSMPKLIKVPAQKNTCTVLYLDKVKPSGRAIHVIA